MTVKQIALVQHRRGIEIELPDYLEEAEIGFSTDTGGIYIGAPTLPQVKNRIRAESNIFPYANIQILTELTDNLNLIRHTYISNTSQVARYPTIITGSQLAEDISGGDEILINNSVSNYTISLDTYGVDLNSVVRVINEAGIDNVVAVNYNGYFRLISNVGSDIYLEETSGTPLSDALHIFTSGTSSGSFSSTGLISRTLQEVLDDHLSIKSYGVVGDGSTDDSAAINATLYNVYANSTEPEFLREVFVPAGVYYLENDSVYFPPGTYLTGEGHRRTIFRSYSDSKPVISTMDGYGRPSSSISFGDSGAPQPEKITVEKIGFEHTEDLDVFHLTGAKEVLFRDCRFKSGGTTISTLVQILQGGSYTSIQHITFENCIFENALNGAWLDTEMDYVTFDDCLFRNIPEWSVYMGGTPSGAPERCFVTDSRFTNVGMDINRVIHIGTNTLYCIAKDNFYDNAYSELTGTDPVETNSSTGYSDWILEQYKENTYLRSGLPNPIWQYVSNLRDLNGELTLETDGPNVSSVPGQDNHLLLTPGVGTTPILLQASKTDGEIQIYTNGIGDVILGGGGTGDILLATELDLNGFEIHTDTAAADTNIVFRTNGEGVIHVNSPSGPYEDKIVLRDDRDDIPNKGYVDDEIFRHAGIFVRKAVITPSGSNVFDIEDPLPSIVNPPATGLYLSRVTVVVDLPLLGGTGSFVVATPIMTGMTTPSGEVTIYDGINTDNTDYWQLFDQSSLTHIGGGWNGGSDPGGSDNFEDFGYGFNFGSTGTIITQYEIYNSETSDHTIKTWELQGSDDNSSWTTLHSVTNDLDQTLGGTKGPYSFTNSYGYQYYRVYVTETNDPDNNDAFMSEIVLYEFSGTSYDVAEAHISSSSYGALTNALGVEPNEPGTYVVTSETLDDLQGEQLQIVFLQNDGTSPAIPVSGSCTVFVELFNR